MALTKSSSLNILSTGHVVLPRPLSIVVFTCMCPADCYYYYRLQPYHLQPKAVVLTTGGEPAKAYSSVGGKRVYLSTTIIEAFDRFFRCTGSFRGEKWIMRCERCISTSPKSRDVNKYSSMIVLLGVFEKCKRKRRNHSSAVVSPKFGGPRLVSQYTTLLRLRRACLGERYYSCWWVLLSLKARVDSVPSVVRYLRTSV